MTIDTVDNIERELREYGDRPPPRRAWIDLADRLRAAKQYLEIQFEAQHFVKHGVPLERFNEVVNELARTRDENAKYKAALKPVLECSIEKFLPGHETYAVEPFYTSATFGVEDAEGDAIQDESIATALNAVREAQRICEGGAE